MYDYKVHFDPSTKIGTLWLDYDTLWLFRLYRDEVTQSMFKYQQTQNNGGVATPQ